MPGATISASDQYLNPPRLHFLYHALRAFPSRYSYVLETAVFERQLDLIADAGKKRNPGVSVEVTFDDGHSSDFEVALPVLNARGLTAQFFITAGWTGRRSGYMDWSEVRRLYDGGHKIGAHGWSHALLTHCPERELQAELRESRRLLEDKLGIPITTMSLPGGRYNRRVLSACQEAGYTKVYTSEPRMEMLATEFTVGRVNITSHMTVDSIACLVQPGSNELAKLQSQYRKKEAVQRVLGDWLYEKLWNAWNRKERDLGPESSVSNEYSANHK